MIPERDFDQVMRAWVDAGEEVLPERNLHLALDEIAQTQQRALRPALIELLANHIQVVTQPLAAAGMLVLAFVAVVLVGGPWISDEVPNPGLTASPEDITRDDLRRITYAETEIIMGLDPVSSLEGRAALRIGLRSSRPAFDPSGFVDAGYNEFSGSANHDVRNPAVIGTYALLLESVEAAEAAYRFLVEEHESPDGWGLEPDTAFHEDLGDESVSYQGQAYERGEATIFLWRTDRLVLMAFGVEGTSPLQALSVARRMDGQIR
jgi:hypothetical protein